MWIAEQGLFDRLIEVLENCEAFGVDTEFIRERTYRPRLCLIQLIVPEGHEFEGEREFLVDPFGLDDLTGFVGLLENPAIEKILHAGHQDMEIFHAPLPEGRKLETYDKADAGAREGSSPRAIFDTQIAAALLGHGDSVGYSRLVEDVMEVKVDKGETFTDWAQRPLSRKQCEYALNDVRHLFDLRAALLASLEKLGRLDWAREEFRIYENPEYYHKNPRKLYERIKGAGKLDRKELAILRELAAWRESEAALRNVPRNRILGDGMLVELARRKPRKPDELGVLRGISEGLIRRAGRELVERVRLGLECPAEERPLVEKRAADENLALVVELLDIVLKMRAEELSIGAGYLSGRKELFKVARKSLDGVDAGDIRVLEGWRRELVGKDLLAFLSGDYVLGLDGRRVSVVKR